MIHPTAEVSPEARIGPGTVIWNHAQVRAGAVIGAECTLARNTYVEGGAVLGDRVKLQNNVSVYSGVTLEDGVFVGPNVTFTNDLRPRALTPEGRKVGPGDWEVVPTRVQRGATIGGGATIVCGVTIGAYAFVGAGAVVVRDVPAHALVVGNPARVVGFVCVCGQRLEAVTGPAGAPALRCPRCHLEYDPAIPDYRTARPAAAG
jgi:UDP-2-acetamido-3-amino-2,3-dideoxy-glucuronate N-acetyltransferase